ncbi:MAG: hypothetical protein ACJ74W_09730 [Pyrinomonadaceae bacterium]
MTLDLWLKIISTFFTAAIGVAAWILAYQQFRLNRTLSSQQLRFASEQLRLSEAKLKFDLYERRLKLFEIVKEFNGRFVMTGKADTGGFYHDTIERHFLFDDDVSSYIGEVYQRALEANRTKLKLDSPNLTEDDRQKLNAQHVVQMQWFYDQAENAPKVFSKDLSINALRQSNLLPVKSSYPQLSN